MSLRSPASDIDVPTHQFLLDAGALAAELNEVRQQQGRKYAARRFQTADHPDGIYLRVTDHSAMWIVPQWLDYTVFEDAKVSFCRSMDPASQAVSP